MKIGAIFVGLLIFACWCWWVGAWLLHRFAGFSWTDSFLILVIFDVVVGRATKVALQLAGK